MDVVIKHPDYKSVMAAHGPEWAQYNDMKPVRHFTARGER